MSKTPGHLFREALSSESPLKIVGAVNAYSAIMAVETGFKAIYLSGAGVANSSFGLPDLGMTTLNDVCEDIRRITSVTDTPLLVDADTGFGGAFNIARTVQEMSKAGAAGFHIEDQVATKRCGHRPGKALVSKDEMNDRVKTAADARKDDSFFIMARTDAHAVEGMDKAIDRALSYVECGADMIFAEAIHTLEEYRQFCQTVSVPVLANITEFGKTPYFTCDQLRDAGIAMVLYPLSAFRAMSLAALNVYKDIYENGTQVKSLEKMQTRKELYEFLNYHNYEKKLDELFDK